MLYATSIISIHEIIRCLEKIVFSNKIVHKSYLRFIIYCVWSLESK